MPHTLLNRGPVYEFHDREPPETTRIPRPTAETVRKSLDPFEGEGSKFLPDPVSSRFLTISSHLNNIQGMRKKKKVYVVWKGRDTGVFTSWDHVNELVHGYEGARYRSFESRGEAEAIWAMGFDEYERLRLAGAIDPVPVKGVKYPPKPVDAMIQRRATALVKSGRSSAFTCGQRACVYPRCMCGVS